MNKGNYKYFVAAFVGNSIFGFSFMFSKIVMEYLSPSVLLTARFGIGVLVMSLLIAVGVVKIDLKGKNLLPLLGLGVLQPVVYFLCENYGVQNSTASFSGLMIGLIPVVAAVMAAVVLKEDFSRGKILAAACSVAGIALISSSEHSSGSTTTMGILFLVGAVVAAAVFNVLTKMLSSEFTAFERTYIMFLIGFSAFFIISMVQTGGATFVILKEGFSHPSVVGGVLYLAIASSVIAFFCLNYTVNGLDVYQSTSFANLTAVISVLAGVVVLGEAFTIEHFIGMCMVLLGVYRINTL